MEKDNNPFWRAELKGREIFNRILKDNEKNKNIKFTELTERVDVLWQKNDVKCCAEIKYRDNYSSDNKKIKEEGIILEKLKYDELMYQRNANGRRIYYAMIFSDNIMLLFDLTHFNNPFWIEKMYPKDSQYNKNNFIKKVVTMLPYDMGVKIDVNKYVK